MITLTPKQAINLLLKAFPRTEHLFIIEVREENNSITFKWRDQEFKLELNGGAVYRYTNPGVVICPTSILITQLISNQFYNEKDDPAVSEADEKLLKDIMNAVVQQEQFDATVGKSVRELAEQGYRVMVEKSNVNHNQINVDVENERYVNAVRAMKQPNGTPLSKL